MSHSIVEADKARLLEAAREACARAYSPYSGFSVGAALLDEAGRLHAGCNVENASYGLTQCAERNALGAALAAGCGPGERRALRALAIYTPGPAPVPPCGACRQAIAELAAEATVFCFCAGSESLEFLPGSLLPHAFGPDAL